AQRVRLEDLAVAVLEHERPRTVEDPGRPPGQRRRVTSRRDAVASRLGHRQPNRWLADEPRQQADRVGSAANAGADEVRQPAVAGATPCWPAPGSAMTRVLRRRLVSSAWPSALLILWAPVWARSSRLRYRRRRSGAAPSSISRACRRTRSARRSARYSGVGRPA